MIDSQLKPCGVISPRVSAAFFAIAREQFVAADRRGVAYVDAPQPLGHGRELLTPLSLGLLVEYALPTDADNMLIIGTGTGYSAAVFAQLAGTVTAVEEQPELAAAAKTNLQGYANVTVVEGALTEGHAAGAPYSLIVIDGGIEVLPQALIDQLAEGGRFYGILIGADGVARAARGTKRSGRLVPETFAEATAALLPNFGKAPAFQF